MDFINRALKNSSGLTLAELLVVIAIIAVTAAIAAPFYQTVTQSLDLSGASRSVASDLRLAQQLSVTTQVNYQVIFNLSGNSYLIRKTADGSIIKAGSVKSPIHIQSINSLPGNTVTFNSIGAATSTGNIVLTNTVNRTSTIIIEPSGYVKIQ